MIGPGRLVLQSFPRRLRILARWSLEEVRVHVCIHGVLRWPSVKVPDESKSIEGRALDRTSLGASFEGLTDEEMIEAVVSSHKPSTNPLIRMVWVVLGSLFVAFAGIGVILPGWPTTSWLVAAAYCFGRSSQRLFRWLLTNRSVASCKGITEQVGRCRFIRKSLFVVLSVLFQRRRYGTSRALATPVLVKPPSPL